MFLLPIAQDVRLRGHFPWVTFAILLACLGIHLSAQSDHDLMLSALKLQSDGTPLSSRFEVPLDSDEDSPPDLPYTKQRNSERMRSMPLRDALPVLFERDPISRWQYHPGVLDWNVVRYAFIHIDWMHLLTNMMLLLLTGVPLERRFGSRRFGSLFIAGAIAGAMGFGLVHRGTPEIGLLGASGAVAALMGAFCYFFFTARFTIFYLVLLVVYPVWGTFRAPAWITLPLWLAIEFAMVGLEQQSLSPVAHTTHVAGFITGFMVALMWQAFLPDLRARYGRLRTRVAAQPANLQARQEAFEVALELNSLSDAQRDLQRVITDAAPAELIVSLYRRLREQAPDFQLKGRMLARVRRAAVALHDHAVQIETTNRLCAVMPLESRLSTWLHQAADAQDAMSRPELAAQTRNFLWEAGVARDGLDPSVAPEGAYSSDPDKRLARVESVRTEPTPAGALAPRYSSWPAEMKSVPVTASVRSPADRCEKHGLAAIALCRACERAVCAVCSVREANGARRCKACLADLASESPQTDAAATSVRIVGSLALFAAAFALGVIPLMRTVDIESIQIATTLLIVEGLWLGVAGFGLCWFRPWARVLMVVGLVFQLFGGAAALLTAEGWNRVVPLVMVAGTFGLIWFLARPQVGTLFYADAASMRRRTNLPVGVPLLGRLFVGLGVALSALIALLPFTSSNDFANQVAAATQGKVAEPLPTSLPVDVPQMLPDGALFKVRLLYASKHWPATSASPAADPELQVEFTARGRVARQTGRRTTAIELENGTLIVRDGNREQSCTDLSIHVTAPNYKMRSPNKCSLLEEPRYTKALQLRVLDQFHSMADAFPTREARQVGGNWPVEQSERYALSKAIFEDRVGDRRIEATLTVEKLAPCGQQRCAVVELNLSGARDLQQGKTKAIEQSVARERLLLPTDPSRRSYAWERRAETRTRTQGEEGVDKVVLRREELSILAEGVHFDLSLLSTAPRSARATTPATKGRQ